MMRSPRPGEGRVYGIHQHQGSFRYGRSGSLTGGQKHHNFLQHIVKTFNICFTPIAVLQKNGGVGGFPYLNVSTTNNPPMDYQII